MFRGRRAPPVERTTTGKTFDRKIKKTIGRKYNWEKIYVGAH